MIKPCANPLEVSIESVEEKKQHQETGVGEEAQELDEEEEGDSMFLRLARGAAEDEQVGGAEEEAAEERLRTLIRFLLKKMILQVEGLHNLDVQASRKGNGEEKEKMKEERAEDEPERVPAEDTDRQGNRANVEDCAGEEHREER